MGYEEIIPLLGDFGRYQRRIFFLLCIPTICTGFHMLSGVFTQATPSFRCQTHISSDENKENYTSCYTTENDGNIVPCEDFIFDHTTYKSTTVTEWNLVCDRAYLKTSSDSLLMFGVMVGALLFGGVSDRFGRKLAFFISIIMQVVFSISAAFSPNYWTFMACRTLVGVATSGYLVSYVIAMEMVGSSKRVLTGTICPMFFSTGYMLTTGFAYFITEWRYLQIAISMPGILLLTYWWFIPESSRWLASKGRFKEAIQLIQTAAKENKVNIENSRLEELLVGECKSQEDTSRKSVSILSIFKYPLLRRNAILLFCDWFIISGAYYGLSWNTSNLGGNDYVTFAISGAVELPAHTFVMLTLNRWGRKVVLCGCIVVAGTALLLTSVVETTWMMILLTMIGKLAITASYSTIYVFATEIFPTVIRNGGLGACSISARIGSIIAPVINMSNNVWKPLPMVIFGALAITAAGLSLQLPETLNKELPETLSDSEEFMRKTKIAENEGDKSTEIASSNTSNDKFKCP